MNTEQPLSTGKKIFIIILVILCIPFIVSGALNVGLTGFWFATPFMVAIILLATKLGAKWRSLSIYFVTFCILFSLTIYYNPLVFPVLWAGEKIEIVKDSLYQSFSDSSGGFTEKEYVYGNWPTPDQQKQLNNFLLNDSITSLTIIDNNGTPEQGHVLYKLKAGQKLSIKRIYNFGGVDSTNKNYLLSDIGSFNQEDIDKKYIKINTGTIQAPWSIKIGDLMNWPGYVLLGIRRLK